MYILNTTPFISLMPLKYNFRERERERERERGGGVNIMYMVVDNC